MRSRIILVCLVFLLVALIEFAANRAHRTPSAPAASGAIGAKSPALVAAHYFGRHGPKNYLNGYRREFVAADFHQLRADGFNAVVLLVPWIELQPNISTCCRFDERAFARLRYLIDEAGSAGLKVVLRVGYGWSFADGDVGVRQRRLLNDPTTRTVYFRFLEHVQQELNSKPQIVLSFLTWEDLWLRRIDESARPDYRAFLGSRGLPLREAAEPLPQPQRSGAERFNAYWDWLVITRILIPASKILPNLGYEARIDRDPVPAVDAQGKPTVRWLGHETSYRLPGASTAILYWAPFWGAQNHGEQVDAAFALSHLERLLEEVAAQAPEQSLFIDQLNIVDNTPGMETNATLAPDQIDSFLDAVPCALRRHRGIGYGIWSDRDYRESPLYNPSFSYGLEGWTFTSGTIGKASPVERLRSSDAQLRMYPGDVLAQMVPSIRGWDASLRDRICVIADAAAPSTLHVDIGAAQTLLHFFKRGRQEVCAPIAFPAASNELVLRMRLGSGNLALRDIYLFDHVQRGGLYDDEGRPQPMLPALRRANRAMVDPASHVCSTNLMQSHK